MIAAQMAQHHQLIHASSRTSIILIAFVLILASFTISDAAQAFGGVDLGTTLVAIKFNGGVVVGADTRTSVSSFVSNRYAQKIVPVTVDTVICRSGSAADTQQIAEQARLMNDDRFHKYGRHLTCSQLSHFIRNKVCESGGSVSLLVAGVDSKPRIYSISPSGALIEESGSFAVSGSGSTFILGYLDDFCSQSNNLEEKAAIDLCENAINLAIARDGSSGGLVRLYVVSASGTRELTKYPSAQEHA